MERVIKEELMDWLNENDRDTLVEEGENILDGLEGMREAEEITENLLLDITEIITALIIARGTEEEMPTFSQVNSGGKSKTMWRMNRAENMIKVRQTMTKMKELRKPPPLQNQTLIPPPDLEIRKVRRRDSSRQLEREGRLATSTSKTEVPRSRSSAATWRPCTRPSARWRWPRLCISA